MKEVTAFICDYCPRKRRFAARGTAVRHESRCFYNPIRKACASCAHFEMLRGSRDHETGYFEDGGPYCAKGALNDGPEIRTQLRSECELWEPKVVVGAEGSDEE